MMGPMVASKTKAKELDRLKRRLQNIEGDLEGLLTMMAGPFYNTPRENFDSKRFQDAWEFVLANYEDAIIWLEMVADGDIEIEEEQDTRD